MLTKIRENIYLGDKDVKAEELKEAGITVVEVVAPLPESTQSAFKGIELFSVILHRPEEGLGNKPHIKDIACHIPKYMTQNGETVAVIGDTGMIRATFVVARAICELESKSIYEVLTEMATLVKGLDIGKAYL